MAAIEVPTEIVDERTGEVVERRVTELHVLPPEDPLACRTCGRRHDPALPHDAMKLHYQYAFRAEHGRWPTWRDAMAHCEPEVRSQWEALLREKGAWLADEPEGVAGTKEAT